MPRKKVLIIAKTYPTLSRKYGETVCTAGLLEDGSWIRIYPVQFRRLEEKQQYQKYDWIECDFVRNKKDPRPESYHPVDPKQMVPIGHIDTSDNWRDRREYLLRKATVYGRLEEVIDGAKSNKISLAVFKPSKINRFFWKEDDTRTWDADKFEEMRNQYQQNDLFEDNIWRKTFQMIPKLPYHFYYRFTDSDGRISRILVLDWEVGALYWSCL